MAQHRELTALTSRQHPRSQATSNLGVRCMPGRCGHTAPSRNAAGRWSGDGGAKHRGDCCSESSFDGTLKSETGDDA